MSALLNTEEFAAIETAVKASVATTEMAAASDDVSAVRAESNQLG